MKKLFLFSFLIPLLAMSQSKPVVNITRVFVKPDKIADFENALKEHVKKYHTGEWSWGVYEIQSGPDFGGYHIVEGPSSWTAINTRGNLGKEHWDDWTTHVSMFLTERTEASYWEYIPALSIPADSTYSSLYIADHIYSKPGTGNALRDLMEKMLPVWKKCGQTVDVYNSIYSGAPQMITITRTRIGLPNISDSAQQRIAAQFNTLYDKTGQKKYRDDYGAAVDRDWTEILKYRKDLSTSAKPLNPF